MLKQSKLEIVHKYLDEHISVRTLVKEYETDSVSVKTNGDCKRQEKSRPLLEKKSDHLRLKKPGHLA
jgi:hypothetical protein